MCIIISRDDNCVNTTTTADNCKKTLYDDLLSLLSSTCVIRVVLLVSYLLVSYFVINFLRRIFAVCHSFRSMYQSGRMKGFESCFKVEDQGAWRRQNLHAEIFCDRLRRGYKLTLRAPFRAIWGKRERKIPPGIKWAPFGERKARYGKYWALFGDSKARWGIK